MIPYIEVRDRYTRLKKTMLTPIDCFFELTYYGAGEFTLICSLDTSIIKGDFITIPNKNYVWVIKTINPKYDVANGYTLTITGHQAKKVLSDRVIMTPKQVNADLVTGVNSLIKENAGAEAGSVRNMGINVLPSDVIETIEEPQATRGDLLAFTDSLLQTKECGAEILLNNNVLTYQIYKGTDRSARVRFSQSFDNLLNSDYIEDDNDTKNYILVEGEEITEEFSEDEGATGLDRKEIYYESNVSTKYTNVQGSEIELNLENETDKAKYKEFLAEAGKEALTSYKEKTTFSGEIDTSLNQYVFGVDYYLGDKVSVKDEHLNIEIKPRVLKMTISQNINGYGEEIEYGEA